MEVGLVEAAAGDAPPSGWRWESYQNVRLAVPEAWGHGITSRPWCLRPDDEEPFVGRPGPVRTIGCTGEDAHTIAVGGEYLWFDVATPAVDWVYDEDLLGDPFSTGPDSEMFRAGLVTVEVQAPPAVRRAIIDSVELTDTDHHGCAAEAPDDGDVDWRPDGPAVTELTDVTAVSACSYSNAVLRSSTRLTGAEAAAAVGAITRAPVGGGPNSIVSDCVPDEILVMEHIVLQIEASPDKVVDLRHGGCFHRGLDDGVTVRTLTREAVQPFVTGPNEVRSWTGEELDPILRP
ncbi:hypothetical protein [Kineosporia succinea]|uniref:Uncharacterized protein n=1 Tax=Kineosporia succinea TaxID=84632 RepID=A0ABT9P7Z9_9ACTN|nr:hypothetical protein [Kineosporia succinea]MDP9828813.1 hypothetical protein [Kineosporia succinea]